MPRSNQYMYKLPSLPKTPKDGTDNFLSSVKEALKSRGLQFIPTEVIKSSVGGLGIKPVSDHGETIDPNKLYYMGVYWGNPSPGLKTLYQQHRVYVFDDHDNVSNDHNLDIGDRGQHLVGMANERIIWPNAWFTEIKVQNSQLCALVAYGKAIIEKQELFVLYGSGPDKCFDLCHICDLIQPQELQALLNELYSFNKQEMVASLLAGEGEHDLKLDSPTLYQDIKRNVLL